MGRKNRNKNKDLTGAVQEEDKDLDETGPDDEEETDEEVEAVVPVAAPSLVQRINETSNRLAASAKAATDARENYLKLQSDYDEKFRALQEEMSQVSQAHQEYINSSDDHAKIQGDLAKLQAELASSK